MAALGTRDLVISVGGTDYTAQVSNCKVTSAPTSSDFVSFADAKNGGGRDYFLECTVVQDTATGTLWDKVWASAGTSAAILIKPSGNAAASTTQPHYSASATILEPDGDLLGGEANASTTARFTIEIKWPLASKPTKVTA